MYGPVTDLQLHAYCLVGETSGSQLHNLQFSIRGPFGRGQLSFVPDCADELLGERAIDGRLALIHVANGLDEILRARRFQQIAVGANLQDCRHVGIVIVGGQDEHGDVRAAGPHPAGQVDSAQVGHLNIQHCYIGFVLLDEGLRLEAIAGLGDYLNIARALKELAKSGAHQGMIIREQDGYSGL